MTVTKHIDDIQAATVDEHFQILIADDSYIESHPTEVTPDDLPNWYDEKLFKAGQQYYQRNMLAIGTAGLIGLIATLTIPSTLQILIFTKQSGTVCTAFKRYLQTIFHIYNIYTSDSKKFDSIWYKSINTIMWKHSVSSRRSLGSKHEGITHKDMALTQFGFLGYVLLNPVELGLSDRPEEREAINHLWRVVGHMLRISDKLNICRKTAAETTELCEKLREKVFAKHMLEMSPNFLHMTSTMLNGMWYVDVYTDVDSLMAFTYHLTGIKYNKSLGLYSRLNMKYRQAILYLCRTPFVGFFVRNYFNYFISLNYWILSKYPLLAWLQFGRKQTRIELYPNFMIRS